MELQIYHERNNAYSIEGRQHQCIKWDSTSNVYHICHMQTLCCVAGGLKDTIMSLFWENWLSCCLREDTRDMIDTSTVFHCLFKQS